MRGEGILCNERTWLQFSTHVFGRFLVSRLPLLCLGFMSLARLLTRLKRVAYCATYFHM